MARTPLIPIENRIQQILSPALNPMKRISEKAAFRLAHNEEMMSLPVNIIID